MDPLIRRSGRPRCRGSASRLHAEAPQRRRSCGDRRPFDQRRIGRDIGLFLGGSFWDDVVHLDCTAVQDIGELCRELVAVPPRADERPIDSGSRSATGYHRTSGANSSIDSDRFAYQNFAPPPKAMFGSTTSRVRSGQSAAFRPISLRASMGISVSSFIASDCSPVVEGSFGRSEGSPLSGASLAPQPCIRLGPCRTRTMKQPFASAARLRGGGPILDSALKP